MTDTLLPLSASPQERAVESVIRTENEVLNAVELIAGVKDNPPDSWLMWLIWEYGLEELLPYLVDPRVAIAEGVDWQRIRGTPESLKRALDWIGFDGATIEEEETGGAHWSEFQIDTGYVPNGSFDVEKVKQVAAISAPAGTRLARIFHGYDVRRLILSDSAYGAILSDYSGVRDADGVCVSYGRTFASEVASGMPDVLAQCATTSRRIYEHRYEDRPLLDFSTFGDVAILNHESRRRRTHRSVSRVTAGSVPWPSMVWTPETWAEFNFYVVSVHRRDYRVYHSAVEYSSRYWYDHAWEFDWATTVIIRSKHTRSP